MAIVLILMKCFNIYYIYTHNGSEERFLKGFVDDAFAVSDQCRTRLEGLCLLRQCRGGLPGLGAGAPQPILGQVPLLAPTAQRRRRSRLGVGTFMSAIHDSFVVEYS